MRLIISLLALLTVLMASNSALAYVCTNTSSTITINIGTVYLNPSANIGDKIGSEYSGVSSLIMTCSSITSLTAQSLAISYVGNSEDVVATDGDRNIYATGISGIGVAIGVMSPQCSDTSVIWHSKIVSGFTTQAACSRTSNFVTSMYATPVVQLYKVAPSSSKTTSINKFISTNYGYVNSTTLGGVKYTANSVFLNIANVVNGCTVNSGSFTVNLGDVNVTDLSNNVAGYYGATATPFNINITCTSANVPVYIQFDPNVKTSSSISIQGVMNIASETGSATGVGIQIMSSPTKLYRLGFPMDALDNSATGTQNIQFYARYVKLSDTVTAGKANSSATYTVTYM